MKLTRDKVSEKHEELKGVYEERIPNGYYEVILRGELNYPLTEYDTCWFTSMFFKKDSKIDKFLQDLLDNMVEVIDGQELVNLYNKMNNIISQLEEYYCNKYEILPQEFTLYFVNEDKPTMYEQTGQYIPITRPFKLFITYNDNGKHFRVEK